MNLNARTQSLNTVTAACVVLVGVGLLMAAPSLAAKYEAEIRCSAPNGGFNVAGSFIVLQQGESVIVDVDPAGTDVTLWSCGWPLGCQNLPYRLFPDETWEIMVVDPAPRIIMVRLVEEPPDFVLEWTGGYGNSRLNFAWGLATGPDDSVFVVEASGNRIQRFDTAGNFILMWGWGVATGASAFEVCTSNCLQGMWGDGAGQLHAARGAVVDSSGKVLVADEQNHRIQIFTMDGAFVETWGWGVATGTNQFERCSANCRSGIPGPGDGQFTYPHSVTIAPFDDSVFVVDAVSNRIQKLAQDGTYLAMYGWGIDGIWLSNPSDAVVDSLGFLYVVDLGQHRIVKIAPDGSLAGTWGTQGSADGEFNGPHGITIDSFDNLYVIERDNHRIQKFDADGNFLTMWGTYGFGLGEFIIGTEVAVDSADDIFAVDHTDRVQKFSTPADSTISNIIDVVHGLNLPTGTTSNLVSNLGSALDKLDDGNPDNDSAAVGKLSAFINKVEAQRNKSLTSSEADALIAWAQAAIAKL